MRAIFSALVLVSSVAMQAQAQQSTSSAGSTTTTVDAVKPAAKAKLTGAFVSIMNLDSGESTKKGSDAPLSTVNSVSATYALSDKESVQFAYNFEVNSVPLKADRATTNAQRSSPAMGTVDGVATLDPYVAYIKKFDSILGSDAASFGFRLVLPMNEYNRQGINEGNQKKGTIRVVGEVPYTLTPKWTVSYSIDPRMAFRERGNTLSYRHFGNVYYNVSDKVQPYAQMGAYHNIGRAGSVKVGEEVSAESFWTGRRNVDGKTGIATANMDQGYAEYGVNYVASSNMALALNYNSTWDMGPGAGEAFLFDNSSYNFVMALSF